VGEFVFKNKKDADFSLEPMQIRLGLACVLQHMPSQAINSLFGTLDKFWKMM
jgi:hypothetical protein